MMWDEVIPAWLNLLESDATLTGVLGTDADGFVPIYPASAGRPVRVPSVEYYFVSDTESELFNPIRVQVDYWAKGIGRAAVIERRVRLLTHRDTSRELGAHRMWTRYLDSRSHDYPADPGVVHRSMDVLFEPLRHRFQNTDGGGS